MTVADRWVQEHGDYLYRFALSRLRRPDLAEDAVQETFLAALGASGRFAGRSSERTWLAGILRNKMLDLLRKMGRAQLASEAEGERAEGLFDAWEHWKQPPGRWGDCPAGQAERAEFWRAFENCLAGLPERMRQVLSLRLLDGVPAEQLRESLGITEANLWVLLHRARLRLWECLDSKGLAPARGASEK